MTLTTPNREPLFGSLLIPDNNPMLASVQRSDFGNKVIDELLHIYTYYPEIRILQFCLMPDHLHAIIHVTRPMEIGITRAMRSYLQGVKRIFKDFTPHTIAGNERRWEKPFLRPLFHHGQLQSMIRYIQMNPARLATKRLKPGFFCVQHDIVINNQTFDAVGNIALLQYNHYSPVHVRHQMEEDARLGNIQPLRDYKNKCILTARQGSVMMSPFISSHEREVLDALIKEQNPVILLADNGFRDYYKPTDRIFDAVASGRLLILGSGTHNPSKHSISRDDCIALNALAEDLCNSLSSI